MQTAIISGLFAFLGAMIALFTQRRIMHDNWLLQRRAETFSTFLKELECYLVTAIEKKKSKSWPTDTASQTKMFVELSNEAWISGKTACLFLSRKHKPVFKKLLEEVIFSEYLIAGSEDMEKHPRKYIDAIEQIFEENLVDLKL